MKNTHCCQCGKPRRMAPIGKGFRLDTVSSCIFRPCRPENVNRNPSPGVYIEQAPSMIIAVHAYRNGGDSDDVHICNECTEKALLYIHQLLSSILGIDVPPKTNNAETPK
jgi:hypothetical protein